MLSLGKGSRARAYKVVCEVHVSQIRKLGQGVEDSRVGQGVRQAEAESGDVSETVCKASQYAWRDGATVALNNRR